MLNNCILVGRITSDLEINEVKEGKKEAKMTLAISRSYKNADGIYETDFIPVVLWDVIAKNSAEYLRKGDVVGIKGRLENKEDKLVLIAEKVTFLSSKKED